MFDTALPLDTRNRLARHPVGATVNLAAAQNTQNAAEFDSNSRLTAAVSSALQALGHPALRLIEIEVGCDVVVLRGQVPTYYLKQLAQSTAQRVDGVRGVTNGIEVLSFR